MKAVCIAGGLRSPIGVYNGMFRHLPAEQLGGAVMRAVCDRYACTKPDYIIGGNSVGGGGISTRLMALSGGIGADVPAVTVDMQCCGGLESICLGAEKIAAGQAHTVLAGGADSSSTQPLRQYPPNHPSHRGKDAWCRTARFFPGLQREDVMLACAEHTARKWHISRRELDPWVLRSHLLAGQAQKEGVLAPWITGVAGKTRDEGIRPRLRQATLDRLRPVVPGGTVMTAANACLLHDGAAFVLLCSPAYAAAQGLAPLAYVRASCACGVAPEESPVGAVKALSLLLQRQGLTEQDVDAFEVNEAFALIDELFARAFPGAVGRYNIHGGALAYGHPFSASGAVILLHLLAALVRRDGRLGCCAIAGAGGLGCAVLIERVV